MPKKKEKKKRVNRSWGIGRDRSTRRVDRYVCTSVVYVSVVNVRVFCLGGLVLMLVASRVSSRLQRAVRMLC